MKTLFLFCFLILLTYCGQPHKAISKGVNVKSISKDTTSILSTKKLDMADTLSFNSLELALLVPEPEKVIHITDDSNYRNVKHLPPELGSFINLKTLELACMEELEDLPNEIGQLKKLEKLIINNGNGCMMNILIPSSIGQLQNLKELVLFGAMDASAYAHFKPDSIHTKIKKLPQEIGELKNLQILDLGRNSINYFPPQIEYLTKLRRLELEYNRIKEIPSYISKLGNLEEINIRANGCVILPNSLSEFKSLRMRMGDCELTLKAQAELRMRFPNIIFDFENEYFDGSNEQEKQ
jgi:hypothetical protein